MAKLVYGAICSLDGYVEDAAGGFEWAAPDEDVHRAVNQLERGIGTYLYGRRMYETMRYWQDASSQHDSDVTAAYGAIWRSAEKVVFSRTMTTVSTPKTSLQSEFDPAWVRALKESSERDLSVGGSELAGVALAAGLVDEVYLYLAPVTVGGGKPVFPAGRTVSLQLLEMERFRAGTALLHYRVTNVA